MAETFNSGFRFSKKTVTVDDDGIHLRRENALIVFIRWDEIERIDLGTIRTESGTKIRLPLTKPQYKKFFRFASEIWKHRYPEKWLRNHKRINRRENWIIYFGFPMFFILPFTFWHLFFIYRGKPDRFRPEMQKIDRATILGLFVSAFLIIWINISRRRAVKNEQNQSKIAQ
jgi:hypothetical protein